MKNKLTLTNLRHKLSWLLCLVAFLAVGQEAFAYKIYCKWSGQSEVYAYFYNSECAGEWRGTKMTSEGNDYYSVEECGGTKVVFNNSTGKTGDLDTPSSSATNNCYDKATSSWVAYNPTTYDYYLVGFNDWANPIQMNVSDGVATCTKSLSANTTYAGLKDEAGFKIKIVGSDATTTWLGNTGTMTAFSCTGWTMSEGTDNNCGITTVFAGNHTFSFNISTNKLSVTYPSQSLTITFNDVNSWGSAWYYIPNNNSDCNWVSEIGFSPTQDGRSLKKYGQMTKNGNTYTVTLNYPADFNGKCITFAKYDQHAYGNFHNNEAVHCDNFDVSKLVCTSKTTQTTTNNTKYYEYSWSTPCSKPTAYEVTADDFVCTSKTAKVYLSGSQTGYTYELYQDDEATGTTVAGTGSAIEFTISQYGTYTVKGYTTGDVSCSADMTGSAEVASKSIPTPPGSDQGDASYVHTTDALCKGATVTFTAPTGFTNDPTSFKWYINGDKGEQSGNTYSYTIPNTDNIVAYVFGINGCGESSGASPSTTFTGIGVAPTTPSAISGNANACQGATETYSVTNVAGLTYNWTLPTGWTITSGANTNSITVTVGSGSGKISVTASSTGCGTSSASELSVTSNAAPAAPTTQGATVCSGNDATLSVTSSTTGLTIKWYSAATGGILLEAGTSYTMIELGSTQTVYAEASTTTGGCASARTATTATVTPLMALTSITASATPICINGTSDITANGLVLGGGQIAYESSSTAAATVAPSGNNAVVTGKNAGTTTITATVSGGCKAAGDPDPTATVDITVNANMALESISLSKSSECIGGTVTITPNGYVPGGEGGKITYSSTNTDVATVSGATITVVGAGSTTIKANVTSGCGSSVEQTEAFTGAGVTINDPSPSAPHEYEPTTFTSSASADSWSVTPGSVEAYLSTKSAGSSTVLKAKAGTYTIKASSGTCEAQKQVTVIAWPDKCTH